LTDFTRYTFVHPAKNQIKYNEKGKLIFSTSLSSGATRTLFSLFYLIAKIKRNKE
jgi:hypothetical protein